MTARLTAERESDIRLAVAYAEDPLAEPQRSLGWLLDELDAVRAERDALSASLEKVNSPEKWMQWCDIRVLERCEAAEATLAAIRAWARSAQTSPDWKYVGIADHVIALLDATPDVPRGTPPANNCADG